MKNRRAARGTQARADDSWALPAPIDVGEGRTAVRLRLVAQGRDLLVLITGGRAHIGAVAVRGATVGADGDLDGGVIQLPNHKEGPLAAEAAEVLARAASRTCAAAVGIHQDDATPGEIDAIVANVRRGLQHLADDLTKGNER